MQGTWVPSLVQENSTCHGATKSQGWNYWSPRAIEPVLHKKRSHRNEKPKHCNWRVVPARHNQRKPECSNKEPVQRKKKRLKTIQMVLAIPQIASEQYLLLQKRVGVQPAMWGGQFRHMLRFLENVQSLSVLTLSFGGCHWYSSRVAKHLCQKDPKQAEDGEAGGTGQRSYPWHSGLCMHCHHYFSFNTDWLPFCLANSC